MKGLRAPLVVSGTAAGLVLTLLLAFVASVLVVAMLAAAGCGSDAYVHIESDPGDAAVSTTAR